MDSPISADPVSALSAIGSAILPKSVTWPRLRAMCPSYRSVIAAIAKIAQAIHRQVVSCPPSANRASRNTGTRISRSTVNALGRLTSDTGGGGRSVIAPLGTSDRDRRGAGAGSTSSAVAIRSMPSLPVDQAAHQVARPQRPGRQSGHRRC